MQGEVKFFLPSTVPRGPPLGEKYIPLGEVYPLREVYTLVVKYAQMQILVRFFNFFKFLYPSNFFIPLKIKVRERYRQVRAILEFNFLPMGPLISPLGPSYVQNTKKSHEYLTHDY